MWRESGMGRKIRCNDCVKVHRKEYQKEFEIIEQLSGLGFSSSFVALYKMSLDYIS
jgi:Zn-finger protein